MKLTKRYAYLAVVLTLTPVGIVAAAPPAFADCTNAGYATVCAQGEVRGGGPTPPSGPAYPGYCADPWYCSDDRGIDINLGRPGFGGGGGGGNRPSVGPR